MPWLLDSLDQPRYGSKSHIQQYTQMHTQVGTKIDYGFDQWSVVSFVFVYLFILKESIYLVIQMYFMQIYFFMIWE